MATPEDISAILGLRDQITLCSNALSIMVEEWRHATKQNVDLRVEIERLKKVKDDKIEKLVRRVVKMQMEEELEDSDDGEDTSMKK
jgi:regulator of replication initiation timing